MIGIWLFPALFHSSAPRRTDTILDQCSCATSFVLVACVLAIAHAALASSSSSPSRTQLVAGTVVCLGREMAQSSDEPIPFIQYRDEKFVVCPEAQRMLSGVRDRIVVVCVAGPYRTGKSFLLNQLIGRAVERSTATTSSSSSSSGATSAAGFAVGSTVQACTKGIWLWGRPVRRNGRTFVFIDTEGLGSLDQSQSFDTQIFSLALLLSSLFVLNTTGAITETVLQELELVVECTKHIRAAEISESSGGATSTTDASGLANLAHYFPDFVWVCRMSQSWRRDRVPHSPRIPIYALWLCDCVGIIHVGSTRLFSGACGSRTECHHGSTISRECSECFNEQAS